MERCFVDLSDFQVVFEARVKEKEERWEWRLLPPNKVLCLELRPW